MTTEIHPKYRPDIDGLRAVAILMVVVFHAFPQWLTGGFVGVDIFFVISGYLISTIIFRETDKGVFSFRNFYARRVKRIFPAFILVLTVCLLTGWVLLFPEEYKRLGKHGFNAAIFLLNINLFQEHGYFETSSELKPLMHFWSLCVEEQYYLIWPVIVALFWKVKKYRLPLLLICMAVSFAANLYLTNTYPAVAFYFSGPRFWELLAGSLLAYWTIYKGRVTSVGIQNAFSVVGAFCLAVTGVFLNGTQFFPGFWAVVPVTGSVLLMASPEAWINRKILANKLAVFIGLISYPLYLWHWPILSFLKIGLGELVPATGILFAAVTTAFILAILTYFLLEKPLRHSASPRKTAYLLISWVLLILLALSVYKHWIPARLSLNKYSAEILAAAQDWDHPLEGNFQRSENFETVTLNAGAKQRVLLWGDSHMEQYWGRVEKNIAENAAQMPTVDFITSGGCPPLPHVNRSAPGFGCDMLYQYALQSALQADTKTIVISALWEKYFDLVYDMPAGAEIRSTLSENDNDLVFGSADAEQVFRDFAIDLARLKKQGKKVYLILSNPTSPRFDPDNLVTRAGRVKSDVAISKADYLAGTKAIREKLVAIAGQTGAVLIDPVEFLCGAKTCSAFKDGLPIYKDSDHLRDYYMRTYGQYFDKVFGK